METKLGANINRQSNNLLPQWRKISVTAGPVYPAATVPVMENNPAPIIRLLPIMIKLQTPKTLFWVGFLRFPIHCLRLECMEKAFLINNPISFYNIFSDNWVQRYG